MTIARFVRHREIPGMAFTNKGVLVELYQDFSIFVNAILEAHIAKVKAIKERNANMALAPVRESINHYLEQPRKILNTSMVKIKNVLQQAESNQCLVHTQAESDRSAIHQKRQAN
ncbi:uncharacterized protein LOC135131226 isoform X2 [Zophobas morio]|uniref:uncharacterized protein LOC135131226 isoform X2 n=1 Tax=Zophobas morio TaxID=2755281 RepID=UPI0030828A78